MNTQITIVEHGEKNVNACHSNVCVSHVLTWIYDRNINTKNMDKHTYSGEGAPQLHSFMEY